MKLTSASFVKGATNASHFPDSVLPEVAFVGKSNVGKSSLINGLLNRKSLVRTSSTPGHTREINFFLINQEFHLVDLPGYGFAKGGPHLTKGWEDLVRSYLEPRHQLKAVVMIVDIRHPPGPLDRRMHDWLVQLKQPFVLAVNKADKLSNNQVAKQMAMWRKALETPATLLPCSARLKTGLEPIWDFLEQQLAATPTP